MGQTVERKPAVVCATMLLRQRYALLWKRVRERNRYLQVRALSRRRGGGAALLLGSRLLPLHMYRSTYTTVQYLQDLNVSIVVVVLQRCYFTSHPIGLDWIGYALSPKAS